jgi:predicted nucleic acid-binding protein
MNLYIDTSALIKLFVQEIYSDEVRQWVGAAQLVSTGLITRAETAAGLNRLARMNMLTQLQSDTALQSFRMEWEDYHRIPITEQIVAQADLLTCQYILRGCDAIHLACALTWSELLGVSVTMASFDRELLDAAQKTGLKTLP